jgi:carbamoyl-phosphate synthase large subunit
VESILIFGGGLNQITLIQSAKDLGYKTIVIDPVENAPAKKIADVFEVVGAKDYETTKRIAISNKVKGIVTCQMENPLLLMARLAKDLNFIFPSEKSVSNARNKFLMKEAFMKGQVPCAKGILINSTSKISEEMCKEIGFPLIIKPVDSFSSRGVYRINTFSEIEKYLGTTRNFSSSGDILIEEFMDGAEVSVESITQNNITSTVQITDKIITPYPTAVEMGHIQPSSLKEETQEEIKNLVKKAIVALGLDNCASHAEVKITKEGPKMVELGARLGGDYITSHLVPLSTGVNIEAAAIQIAMGKKPDLEHKFKKASAIQYLDLPKGKMIRKINECEGLQGDKRIKSVMIFCKEGEMISEITDSAKRPGCVIVQDDDRSSVMNTTKNAVATLAACFSYK